MEAKSPFVITISRQLGSGGSYIGQQLAERLNLTYFDRELIRKAAEELYTPEEELEHLDEKAFSFMRSVLQAFAAANTYYPAKFMPTDQDLFNIESKIIEHIYQKYPAVVIGRCGSYILRKKPNHISVFLHADTDFRIKRTQEQYTLSAAEAEKMIKKYDTQRRDYHMKFTGEDWKDLSKYDMTFDTGKVKLDDCADLIVKYIERMKDAMPV